MRPAVAACGSAEIAGLLAGLDGRLVPPGPSGAPSRGRPEVLPTGRNFYSVDTRAVPTQAAWQLGWKSAALLLERHAQEHGIYPARVALSAWGTANMRTGGDDIAQALALMGVRPVWERSSGRVTGFEILPASVLDRPRVDVTLRVSGFFRDAFPGLIDLFDQAARAVAALEEPPAVNPLAARVTADRRTLEQQGLGSDEAARRAGYRVFGSKPGAYGAGLQVMIDERIWESDADLAEAYLAWSSYAYGAGVEGRAERGLFEARLASADAVLHNQDNREHDILDSDDYYQFEGGLARSCGSFQGACPPSDTTTTRVLRCRGSAACGRNWGASCAAAPPTRAGSQESCATATKGRPRSLRPSIISSPSPPPPGRRRCAFRCALRRLPRRRCRARFHGRTQSGRARRDRQPLRRGDRPRSVAAAPQQCPCGSGEMERAVSDLRETEEEINRRHNEKMARRKAVRERMLASKTEERGLLIVHTGEGQGQIHRCFRHGFALSRPRHAGRHRAVCQGGVEHWRAHRARTVSAIL